MQRILVIIFIAMGFWIIGCHKSTQPVGTLVGAPPMSIQEIIPEEGLAKLVEFTNPVVVVGPPFEVSVGVRNTNHKLPIQIQYLFEYYDSYGRNTASQNIWRYKSLPAAVEMQLKGASISEDARSWRLRIRPAK